MEGGMPANPRKSKKRSVKRAMELQNHRRLLVLCFADSSPPLPSTDGLLVFDLEEVCLPFSGAGEVHKESMLLFL